MIIVIKEQASSDIITLSCVTSFDESYTGSVSSHPVESGSTITDHVTSDNDKFKVSGVVSDYDFLNPSKDLALEDVSLSKEGFPDASRSESTSRFTNGLLDSGLIDVPDKQRAEYIKRRLIDIRKNSLLVTILEYPDTGEIVQHTNCILTSLSFKEDENTGYAVYPEMAFEKINVVQVKVEEVNKGKIPPIPNSKVADAASSAEAKGSKDDCAGKAYTNKTYDYNGTTGTLSVINGKATFSSSYTTASGGVVSQTVDIPIEKVKLDKGKKLCDLTPTEDAVAKSDSVTATVVKANTQQIELNEQHIKANEIKKQQILRKGGK